MIPEVRQFAYAQSMLCILQMTLHLRPRDVLGDGYVSEGEVSYGIDEGDNVEDVICKRGIALKDGQLVHVLAHRKRQLLHDEHVGIGRYDADVFYGKRSQRGEGTDGNSKIRDLNVPYLSSRAIDDAELLYCRGNSGCGRCDEEEEGREAVCREDDTAEEMATRASNAEAGCERYGPEGGIVGREVVNDDVDEF